MYRIENKSHSVIVRELTEYFDKRKLTPTSNLTYWLTCGFPEDLKEINLESLSKFKKVFKHVTKQKKKFTLIKVFVKGKYKGIELHKIEESDLAYINWLKLNVSDYEKTMLKKK
jgi:hypothetical protein